MAPKTKSPPAATGGSRKLLSSATTGSIFEIAPNAHGNQAKSPAFVAFEIPGEPVAFARSGGHGKIRFTPQRQRNFMELVKLVAHRAMDGAAPLDGPVELTIRATYLVPASWPKKRAATARWRTSKPDADNLAKIVSDAINEIVFVDDAQVAALVVQKVYGPLAGVTVSAMQLDDGGAI